ncbi:MAG: hypothetical protein ACRC8A_07615 [Microcoleaceae cyanobacterium]
MNLFTGLALLLLTLTYFVVGCDLLKLQFEPHVWGVIALTIVLLAVLVTTPTTVLKRPIFKWFQSDIGTFISVLGGSVTIVIMFTLLQLFVTFLLVMSATLLARMELQNAKHSSCLAFVLLTLLPFAGLGLSWQLSRWIQLQSLHSQLTERLFF